MKKSLLVLFAASIFQILSSQIPNSDFELWDNQPVPLLWETNSHPLTLPPYDPYVVKKDTDRYSGNFSADLWGNGVFKPFVKTTLAVSQHPASLSLFYKLLFPPCVNDTLYFQQDTVSVRVELLNNSSVVDVGYWEFSEGSSMLWQLLTVPISNNSSQFDSCRITIYGGKVYGGCGFAAANTEFKIDHLSLNYLSSCAYSGVVAQGAEMGCLLIDTGTSNLLFPCNVSLASLGFIAGDSIHFSFVPSGCISFCMQGTDVEITCVDTPHAHTCNASVALQVNHPSSHIAVNGSAIATATNSMAPIFYLWSNNQSGIGMDSIGSLSDGYYCVTISDANNCTATACDSLIGANVCIDSSLICAPGGLCCDAPLVDHVCGCDSVTYINGCVATYFGGATSFYHGDCVTPTGIKTISSTQERIFVSPVPAKNQIVVTYQTNRVDNAEINVLNLLGQKIKSIEIGFEISGRYKTEIAIETLPAGIYWVEVKSNTEHLLAKFVKE
ncbi:MAG: T9SS type A sorting domain-containing protein [Bacteroidetes bacterium]|nr:T9SS type A sorting domain-containing protein [Bacteroidota bacterium]